MKAIQTRYLGPTNTKRSRIKAFTDSQSITVYMDDELSLDHNAELVALKLCHKMQWRTKCKTLKTMYKGKPFVPQQYRDYLPGELIIGTLKNGDNVFCFPDSTVS